MTKKTTLLILLTVISSLAFCQIEAKMKKEKVVSGAILKGGKEVQGYIKKTGRENFNDKEFTAPWKFQSTIKFIPKELFDNTENVKNKDFTKYGPKDCDGYIYNTTTYESVRYAENTILGKPIFPQRMFLEKVLDDHISLYVYFVSPPPSDSDTEIDHTYEPNSANIESHVVYRIGHKGKLKQMKQMVVEEELADCPLVVDRQAKGQYNTVTPEMSNSIFSHILNNTLFREDARYRAIIDYNANIELD